MWELEASKEWARQHLSLQARGGRGVAAVVTATAELPLPPDLAWEMMSHPDNAAIFRGIERCTLRKILHSQPQPQPQSQPQQQRSSTSSPFAAAGKAPEVDPPSTRTTIEVENESDWQFLLFKGSIRTRMVVVEDAAARTIRVRLSPAGGTAPLQHMSCAWRFEQGSSAPPPPHLSATTTSTTGTTTGSSCRVTLEQEVHPRGLHPFFHRAFRAVAELQVRKTFEDLYAEALRINAGTPSLLPYALVAHKQIWEEEQPATAAAAAAVGKDDQAGADADPTSVLSAAYREEGGGSSSGSSSSSLRQRHCTAGALRSHPLLDLPGEEEEEEEEQCCASASSPAAARAPDAPFCGSAATATTATPRTWYRCLEALLQALRGSDATSGVAPNASLLLEEMAVLI